MTEWDKVLDLLPDKTAALSEKRKAAIRDRLAALDGTTATGLLRQELAGILPYVSDRQVRRAASNIVTRISELTGIPTATVLDNAIQDHRMAGPIRFPEESAGGGRGKFDDGFKDGLEGRYKRVIVTPEYMDGYEYGAQLRDRGQYEPDVEPEAPRTNRPVKVPPTPEPVAASKEAAINSILDLAELARTTSDTIWGMRDQLSGDIQHLARNASQALDDLYDGIIRQ